jgi:hypothetical protein
MRKTTLKIAAAVAGAALCAIPAALAADHGDGPAVLVDPSIDITDVYAWMSDAQHVALVMDVFPGATASSKFSSTAKYAFHLSSHAAYGMSGDPDVTIICTFAAGASQSVSCWAGDSEYVTGDASATTGLASTDGKLKVFTGLRDDPFFYNLTGYRNFRTTLLTAQSSLVFNQSGCPDVPPATANVLVQELQQGMNGGAPADDFQNKNVLSIVLQLDKGLVSTAAHPVVSVWGSTNN